MKVYSISLCETVDNNLDIFIELVIVKLYVIYDIVIVIDKL